MVHGQRLDRPLFGPTDTSRAGGAWVTFQPGARTAWHTHPLGQALIVTDGTGWVQTLGGPVEEVQTGDVVWFAPTRSIGTGRAPRRP